MYFVGNFLKGHLEMSPQNNFYNHSSVLCILSIIYRSFRKDNQEITFRICFEYFIRFCVFYLLFAIVCFGKGFLSETNDNKCVSSRKCFSESGVLVYRLFTIVFMNIISESYFSGH